MGIVCWRQLVDSFFFLWLFLSIFPTIFNEFYESKNTNVLYSIFSFKWDPWWSTFVSIFSVYLLHMLSLPTSYIPFTYFIYLVYRIHILSLPTSLFSFTEFIYCICWVYRIHILCIPTSLFSFTEFIFSICWVLPNSYARYIEFTYFIYYLYLLLFTYFKEKIYRLKSGSS